MPTTLKMPHLLLQLDNFSLGFVHGASKLPDLHVELADGGGITVALALQLGKLQTWKLKSLEKLGMKSFFPTTPTPNNSNNTERH